MCDAGLITATLAAVSAGTSLYGASQSAKAQQSAANSIYNQNQANIAAQTAGFQQRYNAGTAQAAAQQQATQNSLTNQAAIANAMRGGQQSAMNNQQAVLSAENQQEDTLRGIGDQASQALGAQTSAPQLAQSQADWQTQAANLLNTTLGPQATSPSVGTNDPEVKAAIARRMAEAASNIRTYGSKIGSASSYAAPMNLVANSIVNNQTGIMPAQMAEQLLKGGSDVRLLPSQLQWANAINYGGAATTAAQQQQANALNLAGLQYQNTTDLANLQQQNAGTIAGNVAAQTQANAAYNEQLGNLISGIGNIGSQAAGYYGTVPDFLKPPQLRSPPPPPPGG